MFLCPNSRKKGMPVVVCNPPKSCRVRVGGGVGVLEHVGLRLEQPITDPNWTRQPHPDKWQCVCCVITVVQLPASPLSGNERAA